MNAVEIIAAKRDGRELSQAEIEWMIGAYTSGGVAEEQMAALLMAIVFTGMSEGETRAWTASMLASGERLDLAGVGRPTTDKHSTGGVGDKTTLALAPAVAACGAAVPQLSGRGLGHTGGTLDKLDAIPGFRTALSTHEMLEVLGRAGAVVCAAGEELVPADRKLYALRDVTATVESVPLIASSIMSKKIAEGSSALVLDVKVGTGAFMKNESDARRLAETMVGLGTTHGVTTVALLTSMSAPLGLAVGNALEVSEAVETLAGGGPADLVELVVELGREMLAACGLARAKDPAKALADGSAMDAWRKMVRAQGGDPDAALPRATDSLDVAAPATGTLARLDALAVGTAAWRLGAGRQRKEDRVSATAGVVLHAKPGDAVAAGSPLLTLYSDGEELFPGALSALDGAFEIVSPGAPPVAAVPLVLGRVGA
ncbi:MAG: thymidine phosphorylase [Acidimicrobiales bacterium]